MHRNITANPPHWEKKIINCNYLWTEWGGKFRTHGLKLKLKVVGFRISCLQKSSNLFHWIENKVSPNIHNGLFSAKHINQNSTIFLFHPKTKLSVRVRMQKGAEINPSTIPEYEAYILLPDLLSYLYISLKWRTHGFFPLKWGFYGAGDGKIWKIVFDKRKQK